MITNLCLSYAIGTPTINHHWGLILKSLGISRDGKQLIFVTEDLAIVTAESKTGKYIRKLEVKKLSQAARIAVEITPDGQTAFVKEVGNGNLTILDIASEQVMGKIKYESSTIIYAISLSQDRHTMSWSEGNSSASNTIKVWDVPTGNLLRSFDMGGIRGSCMAMSLDGKTVFAGNEDDTGEHIKVWDVVEGREIQSLQVLKLSRKLIQNGTSDSDYSAIPKASAIFISPDCQKLICQTLDGKISLWNLPQAKCIRTFASQDISFDEFTMDSRFVYCVVKNYGVASRKLWDCQTGEIIDMKRGLSFFPRLRPISGDGQFKATLSTSKSPMITDTFSGKQTCPFAGHTETVYGVVVSADSKTFISASRDGTAKIWNLETGDLIRTLETGCTSKNIHSLTPPIAIALTAPDSYGNQTLFISGLHAEARVWDLRSGREMYRIKKGSDRFAVSPDGDFYAIAYSSSPSKIHIWDWRRQKKIHEFDAGHEIAALISIENSLVSIGMGGQLKFWDFRTALAQPLSISHIRSPIALSKDGQILAGVNRNNSKLQLWDFSTGEVIRELAGGHRSNIHISAMSFSPDNRLLVTSYTQSDPIETKVWDMASGLELQHLNGIGAKGLAFSPDGKRLVTVGYDVKVWEL